MQNTSDRVQRLRKQRDELKSQLAEVEDFRPGSLVERYLRCGKPKCRCAPQGAAGHGPYWSLTWALAGKTVTRAIPASAVEQTRKQLAQYQRFRKLSHAWVETSAQLCDGLLVAPETASESEAQKKGFKRPLAKPSPRRSRRS